MIHARLRLFVFLATTALARSAYAVVVDTADSTPYTDGTGIQYFSNVGSLNGASCIYLGNYYGQYWVMTAAHVGPGGVSFSNGASGNYVSGSAVRLDAVGHSGPTDTTMFRIDTNPLLPTLSLSTATPDIGTAVTMIGNTPWDATSRTSYTDSDGNLHSGFNLSNVGGEKWGTNVTTAVPDSGGAASDDVNDGYGILRAFTTEFTDTEGNAQAYFGDSGGGVFAADGTLLGMINAIDETKNQPNNTVIFGDYSYMTDVATYRDQILAIVPEPTGTLLISGPLLMMLRRRRRR